MKYLRKFEEGEYYIYIDGKERRVSRDSFMKSKGVKTVEKPKKKKKKNVKK